MRFTVTIMEMTMTMVMALEFDVFKFFEFFGGRFAVAIIAAT